MISQLRYIARTYGAEGLRRRATHELRRKLGLFRRRPGAPPARAGRARAPSGWYRPVGDWRVIPEEIRERIVERGVAVTAGQFEAFGAEWRPLPGPSEWKSDPRTGYAFPDVDWWRISLLPPEADVKDVWEPGRFAWAYDLARAHAVTGDPSFAAAFYQRLSEWLGANPPFRGVQWACGQETALRALAVLHAEDTMDNPASLQEIHREMLLEMLSFSGERIADAIGYGLSQRNNHGISESCGLIHLGLRLRGWHPDAERWIAEGIRWADEQIRDQFAADGWYAQHSFTYTRLALEQVLHTQRVLCRDSMSLAPDSLAVIDSAVRLLIATIDIASGFVPNHGASDGGRAVPLSTAAYRDFRPLLTLAALVRGIRLPIGLVPDAEVLAWIGGELPAARVELPDGVQQGSSGWAVARVGSNKVFIRAGAYTHRPSHLDQLHVDVHCAIGELIADPGSYSYNGPPPWKNALAAARVHNGPLLDDREPAQRGRAFLWNSWPEARLVSCAYERGRARIAAEVAGLVRRDVEITEEEVRVTDQVLDEAVNTIQVLWLIHPGALRLGSVVAAGSEYLPAADGDVVGWFSPTYGLRIPSVAVRVRRDCRSEEGSIESFIRVKDG